MLLVVAVRLRNIPPNDLANIAAYHSDSLGIPSINQFTFHCKYHNATVRHNEISTFNWGKRQMSYLVSCFSQTVNRLKLLQLLKCILK